MGRRLVTREEFEQKKLTPPRRAGLGKDGVGKKWSDGVRGLISKIREMKVFIHIWKI